MELTIADIRNKDLKIEGLEVIEDKEYQKHYKRGEWFRTIVLPGYTMTVWTKDFLGKAWPREVSGISWGTPSKGFRTEDRVVLIPPDPEDGHSVTLHEDIAKIEVVKSEKED